MSAGRPAPTRSQLVTGEGLSTDAAETRRSSSRLGERTSLNLGLTGTAIGDNELKLIVTGPTGDALVKELTLGVRAASGPQTTSQLIPHRAGRDA